MRVPSGEDIKRLVLQTVQPLSSGLFELADSFTAKLKDIAPFGSGDQFKHTYPYGMVAKPIKGVVGYFLHLHGKALAPIIIAHLDKHRPVPSAEGEVIHYCLNSDGTSVPVKLVLGVDGVLTIMSTAKMRVVSPAIELGENTLEKIVNGETFLALYNAHTHEGNLGVPTGAPLIPMVDATNLSQVVKAKK